MSKNLLKHTCLFLLIFTVFHFSFSYLYSASYLYTNLEQTNVESSISTNVEAPVFNFQSQAQYLMEPITGKVLYANHEDEKLLPASVTKVMTLLLIMEQIDSGQLSYSDKVTCSAKASKMGGSQIWFKEGEVLTIDEALKAICVVSANDVTVAMAELLAGSEENFVKQMNEKAKELGMLNTNFMNSHGIDEENHYTTAKDIAIMSRELIIKHPDILKYTSIWQDSLRNGEFVLSNTNKLIRFYEGATGLKTGSTSQALFNLAFTATRNGTTFLGVIMKAPSSDIRLEETKQLLNYAFASYETQNIYTQDNIVETKSISKCLNTIAQIAVKDDISTLIEKGKKVEISQNVIYQGNLKAPLAVDQVVGKIEIYDQASGEKIIESELIVKNEIPRSNLGEYMKKLLDIFLLKDAKLI